MIKQIVIPMLVFVMLAISVGVAYAGAYLPIVRFDGVHDAAIGYGEFIVIKPGHWLDVTCADGKAPTVQSVGNSVMVKCEE